MQRFRAAVRRDSCSVFAGGSASFPSSPRRRGLPRRVAGQGECGSGDPGALERTARNLLEVIYAQEGKTVRASLLWRELVRDVPDYQAARTNLALLDTQSEVVLGETAAVALPTATAAVKAIKSARKPTLEGIKIRRNPRTARQGGGE